MKTMAAKLTLIATGAALFLLVIYGQFATKPLLLTKGLHDESVVNHVFGSSSDTNISHVITYHHNGGDIKKTTAHDRKNNENSFSDNENASDDDGYDNGLTVVTAYFNIGSFKKGGSNVFTNSLYQQWMTVFACIESPLVAFFDNDDDMSFFEKVRSRLPSNVTRIIKLIRNETWSFGLESRIAEIFRQPGYPKHHPNTVVPGYSAAMHAKYEVMQRAIRENPFDTKYFSWLDVGLFRGLTSGASVVDPANPNCSKFRMTLPLNYSQDSVAYTKVNRRNATLTPRDIVYGYHFWLCGCYFVGERSPLSLDEGIYKCHNVNVSEQSDEYRSASHLCHVQHDEAKD